MLAENSLSNMFGDRKDNTSYNKLKYKSYCSLSLEESGSYLEDYLFNTYKGISITPVEEQKGNFDVEINTKDYTNDYSLNFTIQVYRVKENKSMYIFIFNKV